jgi:hypothetical protein
MCQPGWPTIPPTEGTTIVFDLLNGPSMQFFWISNMLLVMDDARWRPVSQPCRMGIYAFTLSHLSQRCPNQQHVAGDAHTCRVNKLQELQQPPSSMDSSTTTDGGTHTRPRMAPPPMRHRPAQLPKSSHSKPPPWACHSESPGQSLHACNHERREQVCMSPPKVVEPITAAKGLHCPPPPHQKRWRSARTLMPQW